jgi:hypothetical protein
MRMGSLRVTLLPIGGDIVLIAVGCCCSRAKATDFCDSKDCCLGGAAFPFVPYWRLYALATIPMDDDDDNANSSSSGGGSLPCDSIIIIIVVVVDFYTAIAVRWPSIQILL